MKKILMGRIAGKNHYSDLDSICATNSLVTGMTRSGKSYKLRTMAESLCGAIPVWIIDPEDEFYTLREKYPFLLFGEGGEAPMAVNMARPLARKLLQWQESAVLSLASLPEEEQHEWVFQFLDELMNRPRPEWRRAIVIADEAHLWAPNSGHGKTLALAAARNLARRGLKRGLIPVWATQRLASLAVAVSSSAENLLVGRTTRSADQEQAAKLLGVAKAGKIGLASNLRRCKKGDFYAVGPAYGEDIVTLQTLPAKTTHFSGKIGAEPEVPATPAKVRYLLPEIEEMLATIVTEEKVKADDKAEIARLRTALDNDGVIERGISEEDAAQLSAKIELYREQYEEKGKQLLAVTNGISELRSLAHNMGERCLQIIGDSEQGLSAPVLSSSVGVIGIGVSGPQDITKRQERIMRGMRDAESLGMAMISRSQCGGFAGIPPASGRFWQDCADLVKRGFIEIPKPFYLSLTNLGKIYFPAPANPISQDEFLFRVKAAIGAESFEITSILLEQKGIWMARAEVCRLAKYGPTSQKFNKMMTVLRKIGYVDFGDGGKVKISDFLLMKAEPNGK